MHTFFKRRSTLILGIKLHHNIMYTMNVIRGQYNIIYKLNERYPKTADGTVFNLVILYTPTVYCKQCKHRLTLFTKQIGTNSFLL